MDDLDRFVRAQDGVHEAALREVRAGHKVGHWMWFIYPQLAGLGRSEMSRHYGIRSLAEARAYVAHPVLGPRIRAAASATLEAPGDLAAEAIFGPIDAIKLRSSMTLFAVADPGEPAFRAVIDRYFAGSEDPRTLELLEPRG